MPAWDAAEHTQGVAGAEEEGATHDHLPAVSCGRCLSQEKPLAVQSNQCFSINMGSRRLQPVETP